MAAAVAARARGRRSIAPPVAASLTSEPSALISAGQYRTREENRIEIARLSAGALPPTERKVEFEVRYNWMGRAERWYTAEEVALAIATAVADDPAFAAAGVIVSALGSEVAIAGQLTSFEVIDETLVGTAQAPSEVPVPAGVPSLPPFAGALLFVSIAAAGRRLLSRTVRSS